ncbi:hypothetical protein ACCO45_012936 [Purpureocillium lilacinum]|uniref:Uncharacterized protein n=1 Tax=Purpureocillium lilacinum TaxID=33203 RepID=A0ACC4DA34_PURLI
MQDSMQRKLEMPSMGGMWLLTRSVAPSAGRVRERQFRSDISRPPASPMFRSALFCLAPFRSRLALLGSTPPSQSQIAIDIANRLSRTDAPRPLDCPALAALLRYPAPAAPESSSILRPAPPARRSHVGRDDVCVGQATRAELKATTPTQPLRPVAPVGRQRNAQLSLARRLVVVRSSHWWALRWTVYGGGTGTTTPKKKDGQAQRGRETRLFKPQRPHSLRQRRRRRWIVARRGILESPGGSPLAVASSCLCHSSTQDASRETLIHS